VWLSEEVAELCKERLLRMTIKLQHYRPFPSDGLFLPVRLNLRLQGAVPKW
jgi:hypothetical protein